MSWTNIYRPQQFSQLHLSKVRQIFLNFLNQGYFPQVLLFTGPKGTGKTTAARILAATLNTPDNAPLVKNIYIHKKTKSATKAGLSEPDSQEPIVASILRGQSFCVQELDAASNRGIDDVRLLKEKIQLPPTDGVMAVYILDEAHMLTTPAFNALLKLLEEPPAHAIFILATTESEKIPDTIKSRCQIIEFKKASTAEIKIAIERVIALEKVLIDDAALDLICTYADGSFRDGLKYLELCAQSGQTISVETVETVISPLFETQAKLFIEFLVQRKEEDLINLITSLRQQGVEDKRFIAQLVKLLHSTLIEIRTDLPLTLPLNAKVCKFLLQVLLLPDLIAPSPIPLLRLELACLDLLERSGQKNGGYVQSAESNKSHVLNQSSPKTTSATNSSKDKPKPLEHNTTVSLTDQVNSNNLASAAKLLEKWEEFLQELAQRNSSLAAFMRSAKPILQDENILQLQVYYKFHQQQLNLPKFKQLASEAAAAINLTLPELAVLLTSPPVHPSNQSVDVLADRPLTEIASELLS